MIHHVEDHDRNNNQKAATFLLGFMFLLNRIRALVLVPALARLLLNGAHKGSVAGSTDAAAQAAGLAPVSPCFTHQNL